MLYFSGSLDVTSNVTANTIFLRYHVGRAADVHGPRSCDEVFINAVAAASIYPTVFVTRRSL